jgi:thiol-disulfide isomerase/thioredoxin
MKKALLLMVVAVMSSTMSFAQLPAGSFGQDFTITDQFGVSHNLYNYLDQGYTVYVDVSATWCGPCKKIEPLVKDLMSKIPTDQIQCAIIDVDESFELYALLKSKRMVNGIPAILAYDKGNVTYIPDRSMAGTDPNQIVEFFNTCLLRARALA